MPDSYGSLPGNVQFLYFCIFVFFFVFFVFFVDRTDLPAPIKLVVSLIYQLSLEHEFMIYQCLNMLCSRYKFGGLLIFKLLIVRTQSCDG
jgi:hypothetical protein